MGVPPSLLHLRSLRITSRAKVAVSMIVVTDALLADVPQELDPAFGEAAIEESSRGR